MLCDAMNVVKQYGKSMGFKMLNTLALLGA